MRAIINIDSGYLSKEERLQGAKHNSKVFTAEELLANFLSTFVSKNETIEEIRGIYANAIIERMKDGELLYSLLDSSELQIEGI